MTDLERTINHRDQLMRENNRLRLANNRYVIHISDLQKELDDLKAGLTVAPDPVTVKKSWLRKLCPFGK